MDKRKILLVDDSKSARFALKRLLEQHGFEVESAESAEVALEMTRQALPDAIFMDHLMPGMDGYEALVVLKQDPRTRHIPVVMCTSNSEERYQQEAKEKGALGVLPKPATPENLDVILAQMEASIEEHATSSVVREAAGEPVAPDTEAISAIVDRLLNERIEIAVRSMIDEARAGWIASLREELIQTTSTRIEELVERRTAETLPDLVQLQITAQEAQLNENIRTQLDEVRQSIPEMLVASVSDNRQLLRAVADAAEATAIEHAERISRENSTAIASESVDRLSDAMDEKIKASVGRATAIAGGAVLLSVLTAAAVLLFGNY